VLRGQWILPADLDHSGGCLHGTWSLILSSSKMHCLQVLLIAALCCILLHGGGVCMAAKARASLSAGRRHTSRTTRAGGKRRSSSSSSKTATDAIEAVTSAERVEIVAATPAPSTGTGSVFSKLNNKGERVLTYYGLMLSGAVARSASATAVHPLNVIKTMLQTRGGTMPELKWSVLSRGAGSQLICSIPHGALSFAVTEVGAGCRGRCQCRCQCLCLSMYV
jgi:hypothetical protein